MEHDTHHGTAHGGVDDEGPGARNLDGVSFDTERRGTDGADALRAGEVFRADLQALNDSGIAGYAELAREGDRLTVRVRADGLEADQTHIQHIHGRIGEGGEARESNVPGPAFDTDGDGFVELAEGVPSYGPVLLNLTSP